jgi:hypothetical protein
MGGHSRIGFRNYQQQPERRNGKPNMNVRHGIFVTAALLSLSPLQSFAKPRPPGPPIPERGELYHQGFDAAYLSKAAVDTSLWAESWSGYALIRTGKTVTPFVIPMAGTNRWNVTPGAGSIRVWYAPGWATAKSRTGGPGQRADLLQLSIVSGSSATAVWSLYVSATGNTLAVDAQGDNGTEVILSSAITWTASQWHLLTLSYSETQTLLYVDNVLAGTGEALPSVPSTEASAGGYLSVGSSLNGTQTGQGSFDELTTFGIQISEPALASYYNYLLPTVDLGPITPAEELAQKQKIAQASTANAQAQLQSSSVAASPMSMMSAQDDQGSGGLYLLAPTLQGTNVLLSIQGGGATNSYNILYSAQLFDGMTISDWSTAAVGTNGQTNFTIAADGDIGFYRVQVANGIPLWELADPSDPNSGILAVSIDNPLNGTTIR